MKRHCVFVGTFMLILLLVQAQNQTGFISIDCGLPSRESPYNALSTGLTYTSDAGLVNNGITGRIAKEFEPDYNKPTLTLRYFPEGIRNCYNLNVTRDTNYLIKATFVYGNYDGLNINPNFDLYFGPNLWTSVSSNDTKEEIIHVTKSNSLQICLVKTGISIPFINILELRPLRKNVYVTQSGSLKYFFRRYLSKSGPIIRYPNDIHDREWHAFFMDESWREVTTSQNVNTSNIFDLPQVIMRKGVTPLEATAALNITWILDPPSTQFYLYAHFAEIQTLGANDIRETNAVLNGETIFGPFNPKPLRTQTVLGLSSDQCDEGGKCLWQLVKTPQSTLPPLLNAIEAFTVIDFPQMETNGDDVAGIKNVQDTYGLSRINWQGDPCVPKQFLWSGLNCNNTDISTSPTITSLNLSTSGLTGTITEAIQNLTHLQKLDLSNNNLTGEIPEFLADIKSLLDINLSGNNLSGSVPPSLLKKKGMQLNVEGNPNILCKADSCVNKEDGSHKKSDVEGDDGHKKSDAEGDGGQKKSDVEGHKKESIVVRMAASIASIAILIGAF